jgi:hypothetical protein
MQIIRKNISQHKIMVFIGNTLYGIVLHILTSFHNMTKYMYDNYLFGQAKYPSI